MVKYKRTRVKHPYDYNFIKMLNPDIGRQKEKLGQRLETLMNKNRMSPSDVVKFGDVIAGQNGFRLTAADIDNYLHGVSPKTDKLYALAQTFNVSVEYLCGYGHSPYK